MKKIVKSGVTRICVGYLVLANDFLNQLLSLVQRHEASKLTKDASCFRKEKEGLERKIQCLDNNVASLKKIVSNNEKISNAEKEELSSQMEKLRTENVLLHPEKQEKQLDLVKGQYFGLLGSCNESKSTIREVIDVAETFSVVKEFETDVQKGKLCETDSEKCESSEQPADEILSDVCTQLRKVLEHVEKVSDDSRIKYRGNFGSSV